MADEHKCEFFLLRYVPDAVKDEFVNIGVVLLEAGSPAGFAGVKFTTDWRRVQCLDAAADIESLEALEIEIRARLAQGGPDRELLLKEMEDSFSSTIQLSGTKAVLTGSPQKELGRLAEMYLEPRQLDRGKTRAATGRAAIFNAMRAAFEHAGVWELPQMRHNIAVAQYTKQGDPLKLDCGYRPNGVVKLFHAVSLEADPNLAKVLAFSYPHIAAGMAKQEDARTELTAVVEADLDRKDEPVAFALETLRGAAIAVATTAELERIAETARTELRA